MTTDLFGQGITGMMGNIFGLSFGGVGLLLVVIGLIYTRKVGPSKDWHSVTGQVVMSTIQMRRDNEGSNSPYPLVVYTYQVGGQAYQSQQIYFGGAVGGLIAQRQVAKYPVGQQVPVYYNPQNPAEAVLERSSPAGKLMLIIGGGLVVFGVAAVLFAPRLFGG